MRYIRSPIWFVLSLLIIAPLVVSAQLGDCSTLVKTALDATKAVCDNTSRNQACYGHVSLDAEAQPGMGPLQFSKVGDRIDLTRLDSLRLSPMDLADGTWGVALMKLQADIPSDKQSTTNVSLLLFGDVQVTNAIRNPIYVNISVPGTANVNVRRQPNNQAFVIKTLHPDDTAVASGRSEDNQWVYVALPDGSGNGWVSANLVNLDGDITTLNVIRQDLSGYGPMQAFYLKTGDDATGCSQASSNDGILVQTPEGVAKVNLWINEVRIRLGSTAFIQAQPNSQMTINTVEGDAQVEALGVQRDVPAGTSVTIRMNSDLQPASPPAQVQAYKAQDVANLPVQNLERPIVIAAPLEVTPEPPPDTPVPTDENGQVVPTDDTSANGGDDQGQPSQPTDAPIVLSLTPEMTKQPPPTQPPPPPPTDTPTG